MKDKSKIRRVTFNEITKKAVQAAFQHARDVDENLVDAQQTRRVLDRLVGYQISPLLWDKVRRGFRAGRVQTVALRLIVEREREIKRSSRWSTGRIDAILTSGAGGTQSFTARFVGIDGEPSRVANGKDEDGKEQFSRTRCPTRRRSTRWSGELEKATWSVRSVEKKERQEQSDGSFMTSKLQQDAARQAGLQCAAHDGRGAAAV